MERAGTKPNFFAHPVFSWIRRRIEALSGVGLALGTLLFAASLTPSLIPRTAVTQGILGGTCFAAGYGIGVFSRWLWFYLELRAPRARLRLITNYLIGIFCLSVLLLFLWRAGDWQNSIRLAMDMKPLESSHQVRVSLYALATFVVLLAIGRLFSYAASRFAAWMNVYVPRRIANVVGVTATIILFWLLANDVLLRTAFRLADSSFREFDALIEPERPQPSDPMKTGSEASLVAWKLLGRTGREFIASGASAADISAISDKEALEPIRVYVGLAAAETAEERAALALEELLRVGAFERKALVVVTPTGTGWIDPSAMDAVEYLHHGDIASVALQYSYLSSPLSLLVQPEYGRDAARAIFTAVYDYWRTLPADQRPKLYLHGLSLGAMNSERSLELFEIIADPIQGALWSGPPFESRMWRQLTNGRNPGTPAWLPAFRDGSFARFMNQDGTNVEPGAPWGPTRIVYLQYASDAVTFFDYHNLYRQPAWMGEPRGPDVSRELRWYPLVTMLQLAVDMAFAAGTPMGHGHVYAPQHYVDAWLEVADISDWSLQKLDELKAHLIQRVGATEDAEDDAAQPNRGG
ncbi:alpha/beta hydrolase [Aquamicrobium zhengzhouense]|uniref:Alpha/beta-hydrolase family protein n=1 Tax=Aquamicrobium zhengzhouense TaxID=2781738 RepID=A0ABS0SBE2_9HYPH|nr:alpha/beta-hydrolase family protein [Aquamicrobium zhengzhouense]MBI1620566.1 alpha/beta-hydrolase family protein [Aquamicrobium zhengzhouense]